VHNVNDDDDDDDDYDDDDDSNDGTAYCFLQSASQIDHGNVRNRNTESHSSKFSIECRDDFTDSLGSSGGRRDDVSASRATSTPVLARRTIDGLLCGRERMDGRHQALDDDEVVVDDLRQRSQTVGRAGSVAVQQNRVK